MTICRVDTIIVSAYHKVHAHYGIRIKHFRLIDHPNDALGQPGAIDETYQPKWELFDLECDPYELHSVYHDPAYATAVAELTDELHRLQDEVGDERYVKDT